MLIRLPPRETCRRPSVFETLSTAIHHLETGKPTTRSSMSSRPARPSHQAFCPSLAPSRLASSRPRLQARRPRGPVACAAPPRAVTVVFTPDEIEEPAHVGECLGGACFLLFSALLAPIGIPALSDIANLISNLIFFCRHRCRRQGARRPAHQLRHRRLRVVRGRARGRERREEDCARLCRRRAGARGGRGG